MAIEHKSYEYTDRHIEVKDVAIMDGLEKMGGEHKGFKAGSGVSLQFVDTPTAKYVVERHMHFGSVFLVNLLREVDVHAELEQFAAGDDTPMSRLA